MAEDGVVPVKLKAITIENASLLLILHRPNAKPKVLIYWQHP